MCKQHKKAKVDELEHKDNIEKEKVALLDSIIDNLKMFIGYEYCYNIYNLNIMFELSKEDMDDGVDQELRNKLNELLQDIKSKPNPKVNLLWFLYGCECRI